MDKTSRDRDRQEVWSVPAPRSSSLPSSDARHLSEEDWGNLMLSAAEQLPEKFPARITSQAALNFMTQKKWENKLSLFSITMFWIIVNYQ